MAEIFNNFFAKQSFRINTVIFLQFFQRKHKLLSTIHITSNDILKIIKNFDTNKAHVHDMVKYLDDENL